MNTSDTKQGGLGALVSGLARAFQWRLMVLWALGLALPALVVALPVMHALSARLDNAIDAGAIAQRFDLASMAEVVTPILRNSGDMLSGVGIASALLALLIAPWLTGMVVASIRAGVTLRFANLLQMGLREYGRMFRMLLWAIVPLGVAFAAFAGLGKFAEDLGKTAILASDVDGAHRNASIVFAVLFVIAHCTIEGGRAVLAAEPGRRSVVKAWWQGVMLLVRRPFAVLVVYLGTMLVADVFVLLFGYARTQVSAATTGGFIAGLLLVQLLVMSVAWGRAARLYGLSMLASDAQRWREERLERKQAAAAAAPIEAPIQSDAPTANAVA